MAGVKVVNSHPKNRALGLPTVMAIIIAVDPKTGFPIAVIEATHLTAMRTAAAGAIAVKLPARSDSSVVALIGAGTQARYQLLALNAVMKRIDEVHVWSLDRELADSLVEEMQRHIKANFVIHKTAREAVSGADIIVTPHPSRLCDILRACTMHRFVMPIPTVNAAITATASPIGLRNGVK